MTSTGAYPESTAAYLESTGRFETFGSRDSRFNCRTKILKNACLFRCFWNLVLTIFPLKRWNADTVVETLAARNWCAYNAKRVHASPRRDHYSRRTSNLQRTSSRAALNEETTFSCPLFFILLSFRARDFVICAKSWRSRGKEIISCWKTDVYLNIYA